MPIRKPLDLKVGYFVQIGAQTYELLTEGRLVYKYTASATLANGSTTTYAMDNLKPDDHHIYWILNIAIETDMRFKFQWPQGNNRFTPGLDDDQWLDWLDASPLSPFLVSFFIRPGTAVPAFYVNNNSGETQTFRVRMKGWQYRVKTRNDSPTPVTRVTDYALEER